MNDKNKIKVENFYSINIDSHSQQIKFQKYLYAYDICSSSCNRKFILGIEINQSNMIILCQITKNTYERYMKY